MVAWSLGHCASWFHGLLFSCCLGLASGSLALLVSLSLVSWLPGLWSLGLRSPCLSLSVSFGSLSLAHSCYVRSVGEKCLPSKFEMSRGVDIHLLATTALSILGARASDMGKCKENDESLIIRHASDLKSRGGI